MYNCDSVNKPQKKNVSYIAHPTSVVCSRSRHCIHGFDQFILFIYDFRFILIFTLFQIHYCYYYGRAQKAELKKMSKQMCLLLQAQVFFSHLRLLLKGFCLRNGRHFVCSGALPSGQRFGNHQRFQFIQFQKYILQNTLHHSHALRRTTSG